LLRGSGGKALIAVVTGAMDTCYQQRRICGQEGKEEEDLGMQEMRAIYEENKVKS